MRDRTFTAPPWSETTLFGRRKGKKLRRFQSNLLAARLPALEIGGDEPLRDLASLFPCCPADVWLEVGFGGGEHLAARAELNPERGFIGCEPFVNGVAKLVKEIGVRRLENVRIHSGDAGALIDRLPEASLAGIFLLYPDPWPKRRQRKRRFVSDQTLDRVARVLRPGAQLQFATDIDDYAGWTLARVLPRADFTWRAQRADDWLRPWDGWIETRYEAKAKAEGRASAYLTFMRT